MSIIPSLSPSDNRMSDATTNRRNHTPNPANPNVGVDTIRVRGLHRGHDLSRKTERTSIDPSTGEVRVLGSKSYDWVWILGHRVSLQSDDRQGGGVSFECSVPKVSRRTNEVASSIEEVEQVVQQIFHAASYLVDWTTGWSDLEVRRVDLVRGFDDVRDISATLNRLAVVHQSRGRVRKVFTDPRRGEAQTLTVGTARRWMCTAYDKATEMQSAASKTSDTMLASDLKRKAALLKERGHLRVEISVRAKPLKERLGSNRLVEILKEDVMNTTAKHYFQAAGLDTAIGGTDKVNRAIRKMSEDTKDRGVADRVIGMLFREANGIDQIASRNSMDTYRQVARRYNLTSADFYQRDEPPICLDWNRGLQVAGITA